MFFENRGIMKKSQTILKISNYPLIACNDFDIFSFNRQGDFVMAATRKEKYTIQDFKKEYPNDDACLRKIFMNRYGNLKICPHCEKATTFHKVRGRKCYECARCGFQLHPLANTIFHKSSTSLRDWFLAMFLFASSKNSVSGKELERQLGVTYKTAWRIGNQIRKLF